MRRKPPPRNLPAMFSYPSDHFLKLAHQDALARGLSQVTVEGLVLIALDDPEVIALSKKKKQIDLDGLRLCLETYLENRAPKRYRGQGCETNEAVLRILKAAAQKNGQPEGRINGSDILLASFAERESVATYYMRRHNLGWLTLNNQRDEPDLAVEEMPAAQEPRGHRNLLRELVATPGDAPIIREALQQELERHLATKQKKNVLLLGAAGVGKTQLVHALAHRIATAAVPETISARKIFALDLPIFTASVRYRGDLEKRLFNILTHCGEQAPCILFLDDIHILSLSHHANAGGIDPFSLLKLLLYSLPERVQCIATTMPEATEAPITKDIALMKHFHLVNVTAPQEEVLQAIVDQAAVRLATLHRVAFDGGVSAHCCKLCCRYLPQQSTPEGIINLLDVAAATAQAQSRPAVDIDLVNHVISEKSLLPIGTITTKEQQRYGNLERSLSEKVLGQPDAVRSVARAMLRHRFGFTSRTPAASGSPSQKPIGMFLFVGPSGVGKTHLSLSLADALALPLLRFDMSEYQERFALSRLLGSPPGYVGYNQPALLTSALRESPHCVLLLDEIEKADPSVCHLFLQAMDYGVATDHTGKQIDFRHCVIIMTSNAAADAFVRGSRPTAGFDDALADGAGLHPKLRGFFSPEFINRFSAIIPFQPLSATILEQIADSKIAATRQRLAHEHRARVRISKKLTSKIRHCAVSRGARSIDHLVESLIIDPVIIALMGQVEDNDDGAHHIMLDVDGEVGFARTIARAR